MMVSMLGCVCVWRDKKNVRIKKFWGLPTITFIKLGFLELVIKTYKCIN